jgi:catechol 2,3-dioxygenase-like lactoylglutathione lyase family enzyme
MIGYTIVGTNDVDRARGFYDALFGAIGVGRLMEFGPRGSAWGGSWDRPMFGLMTPHDGQPATVGNGTMVALAASERATVDTLYAKAIELGGTCEGPPGVRGEEGPQAFYAAYFRDLDGNKLAAFRIGPA